MPSNGATGMIWAGNGMMPSNKKASQRNDLNYVGLFCGAMSTSPVAEVTAQWIAGRK